MRAPVCDSIVTTDPGARQLLPGGRLPCAIACDDGGPQAQHTDGRQSSTGCEVLVTAAAQQQTADLQAWDGVRVRA